jgi:hypothetical protein
MANQDEEFPVSAEVITATLADIFQHQGNIEILDLLRKAQAQIPVVEWDRWDGGTCIHTYYLDIPVKLFANLEPRIQEIEREIFEKINSTFRDMGNHWVNAVIIKPIPTQAMTVTLEQVTDEDVQRIWSDLTLRLFVSHVAAYKVAVSALKEKLSIYQIAAFVAHEDIEPNSEWQDQIELALRSMHVMIALLTPDFNNSRWTDQEIGFALGRGVMVIPVKLGLDPYGFIGKIQGVSGKLDNPSVLAQDLVGVLLKQPGISRLMYEALVVALERSSCFTDSILLSRYLVKLEGFTREQKQRLLRACEANRQVREAFNVPERIRTAFGGKNQG